MNKYRLCKGAVAISVSSLIVGAIGYCILNAAMIATLVASLFSLKDILDWLYYTGPVICATISSIFAICLIILFVYDDTIVNAVSDTVWGDYFVFVSVCVSMLFVASGVLAAVFFMFVHMGGEGPLSTEYGLSIVPVSIITLSWWVYHTKIAKRVCRFVRGVGDD